MIIMIIFQILPQILRLVVYIKFVSLTANHLSIRHHQDGIGVWVVGVGVCMRVCVH